MLLKRTQYEGLYYKQNKFGKRVFVARFKIGGRSITRAIGVEGDKFDMTAKKAFLVKEELVRRMKGDEKTPLTQEHSDNLFGVLFQEYIEIITPLESEKTVSSKSYMYKSWLTELAKKPVEQITEIELQRIVNRMLSLGRAPTTADKLKNLLMQVLNLAIKKEFIKVNHAKTLRVPEYDDTVQLTLSIEEMQRLYHTIMRWGEPLYRKIFVFLLHGRRMSEVLTLTWKDIDLANGAYTINSRHNKARKNMTYQLLPVLSDMFSAAYKPARNTLVFPSPITGKRLANISRAWARIKRAAGIEKPLRIHDLRHILGYVGANAGLSEEILAAILGHSSTKVTKRYYQIRAKTAARGIEKIHGILNGSDIEAISQEY